MYMLWDCPDVQDLWDKVLDVLYNVTRILFPKHPVLLLLNYHSQLPLSEKDWKCWLAAMNVTKKILVQHWNFSYMCFVYFLELKIKV